MFVRGYAFLFFIKNMHENMSKNSISKCSQKRPVYAKLSAAASPKATIKTANKNTKNNW